MGDVMSVQDFFFYTALGVAMILCIVVMIQNGEIHDLKRDIKRLGGSNE